MNRRYLGMIVAASLLAAGPALARELSEGVAIEGTSLYLANVARRAETKGDYKTAIVIYDELLKRRPGDDFMEKKLASCEKALEAARDAGSPSIAERPQKLSDESEPSLPPDAPELGSKELTPDLKQQ